MGLSDYLKPRSKDAILKDFKSEKKFDEKIIELFKEDDDAWHHFVKFASSPDEKTSEWFGKLNKLLLKILEIRKS